MEKGATNYFEIWGAVFPASWALAAQLWRLVTYQFLHSSTELSHIVFNMIAIFFLGPRLETYWGSRRFIIYYLFCGAAAGLLYVIVAMAGILPVGSLVGASGAILGIIAACIILFPRDTMFLLFIPVPMRIAGIIFIGLFTYDILTGENPGGNVAHLGGMAAGAAYVWLGPKLGSVMITRRRSAWDKKMDQQRRLQLEVDKILDKVHDKGLASLTRTEKKMLQEATRLEQERRKAGSNR
jgi:membrane associated rhomboid family serine protease